VAQKTFDTRGNVLEIECPVSIVPFCIISIVPERFSVPGGRTQFVKMHHFAFL
jgi:hypothetical protein